ncbi:MAG: ABC transporter permease subunit [Streptomycetaceae bacterium]|nr:MAG: ABC transporter permease subunit [Streptomycetaceae bacterium]
MKAIRQLIRNPFTRGAFFSLCVIAFVGIFSPLLTPYSPTDAKPEDRLLPPGHLHYFGTDELGRDIFSRIIAGTRVSVGIALFAILLSALVGTFIGSFSGFIGRWIDQVIMRSTDVLLAFPTLVLALALSAALGPSIVNAALAIAIVKLPIYTRLARTQALSVSHTLFVKAAKTFGVSSPWIVRRHIVPNLLTPIIVQTSLDIGDAILLIATLGFLGLGAQPPTPEWGAMISTGWNYLLDQWWYPTFTGAAIFIAVIVFNIIGDGIRDLLDPKAGE